MDAAITSAGGWPLDLTFYQTVKGITAVQHIVKPGGKILIVSECAEGAGSPEFTAKLAQYAGPQSFLDSIAGAAVVPDQWQLEKLALVALNNPVLFYTPGLQAEAMGSLGSNSFRSIDDAVAALVGDLGPQAHVAVVPDGPYAYARVQDEPEAA
jgi:nickel-dependent lactate racemase